MKITVSVIKADIGSIGGRTAPSPALMEAGSPHVRKEGRSLLVDFAASHTGELAKARGQYGAGQDPRPD